MKTMQVREAKASFSALIEAAENGEPTIITKHGKPVVKLVPANEGEDEIFGALASIARIKGDIENTIPAGDWGVE